MPAPRTLRPRMRLTSQAGGLPAMLRRYWILRDVSARTSLRPRPTMRSPRGAMTRSAKGRSTSALSTLGAESSAWIAATERATPRRSDVITPITDSAMTMERHRRPAPTSITVSVISHLHLGELGHRERSDAEQHRGHTEQDQARERVE